MVDRADAAHLRALLSRHPTLYAAAAAQTGARPVTGRGPAYAITVSAVTGPSSWLVRHYRRGGAFARILDDRYARFSAARALRELTVSTAARSRGIATPRVIAALEYPAGLFKRFDIAVAFIPHAHDLAEALFGDMSEDGNAPNHAQAAAEAAARLIRMFIAQGLLHKDLNLKNILVRGDEAWVIDLDRCRLVEGPTSAQRAAMKSRFLRSLAKWERQTARTIGDPLRRTMAQSFHG